MKFLGIYISSDLDRRSTVSHRIRLAYRAFYMLYPLFRSNRVPFDTLLRLYHNVILPAVLYGIKVATITKQNRQSLRRIEQSIVLKLRGISRDPPITSNITTLLSGRTITRKCRVHRLKCWGHIRRRPIGHILRKALRYRLPGKLKRSRPCYTWNDSLERDLRRAGEQNWEDTIHDAKLHNAKCDNLYNRSDTDESEL